MAVILDQLQIEKLKTLPNFTLQHLDKVTELYQHLFYDPFASICGFKSIWCYQFLLKAYVHTVCACISVYILSSKKDHVYVHVCGLLKIIPR